VKGSSERGTVEWMEEEEDGVDRIVKYALGFHGPFHERSSMECELTSRLKSYSISDEEEWLD
jgi:hypothetical protein